MFKMRGKMIRLRRNTHLCQMLVELCHLRLLLADIDYELFKQLHQAFIKSKDLMELVNACDKILYRRMEKRIVYMKSKNILGDSATFECTTRISIL